VSLDDKIEAIRLQIEKFACAIMLSEHMIADAPVEVVARYAAEEGCYHFRMALGVPVGQARHNDVIAEYPATLWDHIKQRLGLKHKLARVTYTEVITFPTYIGKLHGRLGDEVRIYQHTGVWPVASDTSSEVQP
jgi:hypothetical protein